MSKPDSLRRNIAVNYASQVYVALIGIAMVPLYLKYMGIEAYGLVGFFAMVQAWSQVLDFGLSPTLGREAAKFNAGVTAAGSLNMFLRLLEIVFGVVGVAIIALSWALGLWVAESWLKLDALDPADVARCVGIVGIVLGLRLVSGVYRGGGRHLAIRGGGSGPDLGIELDPRVFPLPARRRCRGGRAAESRAAQIAPRRPGPRISMGNAEGTDTLREGARVSHQHVGRGQPGGQVDPVAHAAAAGIRGIRPGNDDRAGHDPGRVAAPAGRSSPPHRSRREKGARKARSPVSEDHDPAGRLARGFRRRDGRVSRPGSLRVDGRRRGRLAGRRGPQMVCRRNLFHGGGDR